MYTQYTLKAHPHTHTGTLTIHIQRTLTHTHTHTLDFIVLKSSASDATTKKLSFRNANVNGAFSVHGKGSVCLSVTLAYVTDQAP